MLSCKKSLIETNIKDKETREREGTFEAKAATEMDIAQALRLFDKEQHRVLMAMLKSGVVLAKIEVFRDLFERMPFLLPVYPT